MMIEDDRGQPLDSFRQGTDPFNRRAVDDHDDGIIRFHLVRYLGVEAIGKVDYFTSLERTGVYQRRLFTKILQQCTHRDLRGEAVPVGADMSDDEEGETIFDHFSDIIGQRRKREELRRHELPPDWCR